MVKPQKMKKCIQPAGLSPGSGCSPTTNFFWPSTYSTHRVDALRNAVEAGDGRDLQQDREAPVQRARQVAEPDGEQGGKD